MISITGKTAEVLVGQDRTSFNIHEQLLRSRSSFFSAALNKCWREGRESRIELPEDSVDVVQRYFQFLYSGKVFVEWTLDSSKLQLNDNLPEFWSLAHLYVFGEKVQDAMFKNAVSDMFVKRIITPVGKGGWSPIAGVVDVIYKGTMPGSPARQLMVDCHYSKGGQHWIVDNPDANNKEFLMDLCRRLFLIRKNCNPPPSPQPTEQDITKRTYHQDIAEIAGERP